MPSLKILHLVRMWPHSGNPQYGTFIQKHIDAIGREGLEQSVLVLDNLDVHETDHGIPVSSTSAPAGRTGWERKFKEVLDLIETHGLPDIVHAHGVSADTAYIFLRLHMAHGHRVRRVVTEHGSQWIRGANRGAKWSLRLAHARTAVSPYLASIMSDVASTVCIPNIIEPATAVRDTEYRGGRRFLNVSDWVDQTKGLTELLSAWKQHSAQHPDDVLTLIGDGEDREHIQSIISGLDRVSIPGAKTPIEVHHLMTEHDVLIVNSRLETFSMVIGEAIARGLHVISTPLPGPQSVYTDHPIEFRQGTTEHVEDLIQVMSRAPQGQSPVDLSEFKSSTIADQFIQCYQGLYHQRKR